MVLRTAACEWRFLRTAFRGILTTGRLATAVRFGSRPAPPAGRHLTGPKGLQDVPYESGPVDRLLTAIGGLRIMFSLNAVLQQFVFLVFLIAYHEYPALFVEHDGQVIVRVDDVGQEVFVTDGLEFIHEFEGWTQLFQGVAFLFSLL